MKETEEGILVPLKITPKASNTEIVGWEKGELKIRLAALPEKGRANEVLMTFLAKQWKISKSRFSLVRGETSRHKILLVQGLKLQQLEDLLSD